MPRQLSSTWALVSSCTLVCSALDEAGEPFCSRLFTHYLKLHRFVETCYQP